MSSSEKKPLDTSGKIAIVGLACRFPGAASTDEFWDMLANGVEGVVRFDELQRAIPRGIPEEALPTGMRVCANGNLAKIDCFDQLFFGFTDQETIVIDPQHRLGLEVAWQCLLDAGIDPSRDEKTVGVFTGCSLSTYLLNQLLPDAKRSFVLGGLPLLLRNDKDYLASLLAYKFGLTGPVMNVGTSCSSGLAAVHLGAQYLLSWQCDVALCGASSIMVPQFQGHLMQAESIYSDDGYCRPFDASASGTVGGSGVGFLALKRLEDALKDGDSIHAVILGSAINNDGRRKVGFTAPSVEQQANVIAMAHAVAGVDATEISMVEAHGTGTSLGDPIEVDALTRAFRRTTPKSGYCALGSVKSNIGHLDSAAGIAGLIKTVLALKHKAIPPTLHYNRPNPKIDFDSSPFFINKNLLPWQALNDKRIAGVSAFGMGGTNVHMLVEEASVLDVHLPIWKRAYYLLPVSAHHRESLDRSCQAILANLSSDDSETTLGTAAYALSLSPVHSLRRAFVVKDVSELASAMSSSSQAARTEVATLAVCFASSELEFLSVLYSIEPGFRAELNRIWLSYQNTAGQVSLSFHDPQVAHQRDIRRVLSLLAWGAWLKRLGLRANAVIGLEYGIPAALMLSGAIEENAAIAKLARMEIDACLTLDGILSQFCGADLQTPSIPLLLNVDCSQDVWRDGRRECAAIRNPNLWLKEHVAGACCYVLSPDGAHFLSRLAEQDEIAFRFVASDLADDDQYRRWLEMLAKLWESGWALDWRYLYGGQGWRRAPVPQYPFLENKFWFHPTTDGCLPDIEVLLAPLTSRYQHLTAPNFFRPIVTNPGLHSDLNAFSLRQVYLCLRRAASANKFVTRDEMLASLEVHSYWHPFLDWMLGALLKEGWIRCDGLFYTFLDAFVPQLNTKTLVHRYPQFSDLFELIGRFGQTIDQSLQSREAGTKEFGVAFRNGSLAKAINQPGIAYSSLSACCRIAADFVEALTLRRHGLRVLEVGTGGQIFTQYVEALLRSRSVDYWATDFDPMQVRAARKNLDERGLTDVKTAVVDINHDLLSQGLLGDKFDIVVGVNVMHLCSQDSLRNLRDVLTPDGCLLIIENVNPTPWQNLIWGWAEGWWDAVRHDPLLSEPLRSASTWAASISRLGPRALISLPCDESPNNGDTALFIAQFSKNVSSIKTRDRLSKFDIPPREVDLERWLYRPTFTRSPIDSLKDGNDVCHWIVFDDQEPIAETLANILKSKGSKISRVTGGARNQTCRILDDGCYELDLCSRKAFDALFESILGDDFSKIGILWASTQDWIHDDHPDRAKDRLGEEWTSILALAQSIGGGRGRRWHLVSVVRGLFEVTGDEVLSPGRALLRSAMKVLPREYPFVSCRTIDILNAPNNDSDWNSLCKLIHSPNAPDALAWRGRYYWTEEFQPIDFQAAANPNKGPKQFGCYVLFGGLGGIGFSLAGHLAVHFQARLLLVGRTANDEDEKTVEMLKRIHTSGGTAAIFRADLGDLHQVEQAIAEAEGRFGRIDGVIHCAGVIDEGGVIARRNLSDTGGALAAKVNGALNIGTALDGRNLDFLVMFSSLGSILYKLKFGEAAYLASNDFLAAYAKWFGRKVSYPVQVIHWSDWEEVGMWARSQVSISEAYSSLAQRRGEDFIASVLEPLNTREGFELFCRSLTLSEPCVVVATQSLDLLLDLHRKYEPSDYGKLLDDVGLAKNPDKNVGSRHFSNDVKHHGSDTISSLRLIWEEVLGCSICEEDDFFDLGGDSLLALRVVSRISEKFGVDFPLQGFFSASSLGEMAAHISMLCISAPGSVGVIRNV